MSNLPRFDELIRRLDAELPVLHRGAAHRWINETQDGAWTKATAHFQAQLADPSVTAEQLDETAEIYGTWCVNQYRHFKEVNGIDCSEAFFESVRPGGAA